jgi:HrpA-like RNA helicase
MGERIKYLPLSPMLSRFVDVSTKYNCVQEALIVAAFCSTDDFFLPIDSMSAEEMEQHKIFLRTFQSPNGDHERLVKIYRYFKKQSRNSRIVCSIFITLLFLFRNGAKSRD